MVTTFLFIIGIAIGSFLNVLADRLSNDRSILGRSKCEFCKKKLRPLDMIPLLSFVFLKGKCHYCKKKLSLFYPFVELVTGIAFVYTWYYSPINITSVGLTSFSLVSLDYTKFILVKLLYLSLISSFIVVFFADVKYQIIPDEMQISLFIITLFLFLLKGFSTVEIFQQLIAGVYVLVPIGILYVLSKGRAMGFGDVKFAFIMGFLLGWFQGFIALYIAFVLGGLVGLLLLLSRRKKLKSKIAFGPFLIIGTLALIFFQAPILVLVQRFL